MFHVADELFVRFVGQFIQPSLGTGIELELSHRQKARRVQARRHAVRQRFHQRR